jgi:NAD(P)-dependent dehydrogenase (short-subunit alcohol dehydrogenase family)
MGQLDGKTAVITGAARGFGRAVARLLAREGADIALSDIARNLPSDRFYDMARPDQLKATAAEIQAIGRRAIAVQADVTVAEDCRRMAEAALAAFGRIDILVANAGVWTFGPAWEFAEEEWDLVVDVNLKGAWLTTKYVVPHMIERRSGRIVLTSSIGGIKGYANLAHYIAAKHGVVGYMRALAIELGPYDINVNAICPTQMGLPAEGGDPDPREGRQNLFEQRGTPSFAEVAQGVLWLVSDASRMVTGLALPMDNGWVIKRGG